MSLLGTGLTLQKEEQSNWSQLVATSLLCHRVRHAALDTSPVSGSAPSCLPSSDGV